MPHPSERGLLTQPLEDLVGVGLLAERLEFSRKLRMSAEGGNHGSTKLPVTPNSGFLELLEVLELLH